MTESAEELLSQIVKILGGVANPAGLRVIDTAHDHIHDGEAWHASHTFSAVGNGSSVDLQITTGKFPVHLLWDVAANTDVVASFYEAPTSSVGTPVPVTNRLRSSEASPGSSVVFTPTVSNVGSLISNFIAPETLGRREVDEWILKPETKYLLRATNQSGANRTISMRFSFYEDWRHNLD